MQIKFSSLSYLNTNFYHLLLTTKEIDIFRGFTKFRQSLKLKKKIICNKTYVNPVTGKFIFHLF